MASRLFQRVLKNLERGGSPGLRRRGWKLLYNILGRHWRNDDWRFMNYGYLPEEPFPLEPEDEPDRPFIGLYDHVARGLPLDGADVLEIGSGRGGGARYVARYFGPERVLGVDFSPTAVDRARRINADAANLAFAVGDAESLDLADDSFDVVLNVESSHCYGDMSAFVAEAWRTLKPGGYLGWADMRSKAMAPDAEAMFLRQGFVVERSETLSEGVVRALDAADARKREQIAKVRLFRRFMTEFAGAKGTVLYRGLASGGVVYMSRRFRKPS